MRELLLKMAGGEQSPPRAKAGEIFSAWVGSCLAIACIALLERYATGNSGFPLLIGSFGASAVLACAALSAILVVVGRALRKQGKRRGRGREARKRQRREGGVPVMMKAGRPYP